LYFGAYAHIINIIKITSLISFFVGFHNFTQDEISCADKEIAVHVRVRATINTNNARPSDFHLQG
jgi:hypothetical protein